MSSHCTWLVVVGGIGTKLISQPNTTMIVELSKSIELLHAVVYVIQSVCSDSQWSVDSILDSDKLATTDYLRKLIKVLMLGRHHQLERNDVSYKLTNDKSLSCAPFSFSN